MSSEEETNKALVRRFLEELVKWNLDVIDELLPPSHDAANRTFSWRLVTGLFIRYCRSSIYTTYLPGASLALLT